MYAQTDPLFPPDTLLFLVFSSYQSSIHIMHILRES
jgi:hypothetical protein